jgi:pilus assembly protein Flp/PilA
MLNMCLIYLRNFIAGKKGQGMVEYGLIIGLIAVAVVVVLGTMGGQINTLFQRVSTELGTAIGGGSGS